MNIDRFTYVTTDGRIVTLTFLSDRVFGLEVDGHIIARFSEGGITIDNQVKETPPNDRHN